MDKQIKEDILSLVENAKTAYVSSVDEDGFPNTKAMYAINSDGLGVRYFSTNVSSKRASQFKANPKSCIYIAANQILKV